MPDPTASRRGFQGRRYRSELLQTSSYRDSFSRHVQCPFRPSAKEILKQLRSDRTTAAAMHGRLAEVHKKLANVPQVERKARARLAQAALTRSTEGRALLEEISKVGQTSLPQFLLDAR